MLVAIVSSLLIAILIVGLAVSRYYIRRKKHVNDTSYSVTRYARRQLASTSCDNLTPTAVTNNPKSQEVVNETTHIIKSSFSWPETSILHRQEHESAESSSTMSSSSSADSSTSANTTEPASLTFSLRWNELSKSLFVRVISARDLFIHKRHRQPSIIDSYVRIELLPTPTEENTPGNVFIFHSLI